MKLLTDSAFAQDLTELISFLRSRHDDRLTCLIRQENVDTLEQIVLSLNDQELGAQLSQCIATLEQPPMESSLILDSPDSLLMVAEIIDHVIISLKSLPNTIEGGMLRTILLDRQEKLEQLADQLAGFISIINDDK
jgi:hypothetical protein